VIATSPPSRATQAPQATDTRRHQALYLTASATLIALVFLERWVLSVHSFSFDVWSANVGMSHKPWPVWDITRLYQQVGRPLVAIGEVLVMTAWLWHSSGGGRDGRRAVGGLVVALVASAICKAIKIIWGATPLWRTLPHHVGANFPSGVVTFMVAAVGYVALVGWRQGHRTVPRLLVLAILGAGPSRVIGGQHLLSDVVGAYMLGAAWLILASRYLTWTPRPSAPVAAASG
jgi:membrane-associated phospholipid phosphatase